MAATQVVPAFFSLEGVLMPSWEQRISLRHLRLADAIEREGSLVRAAERLNMTQSAVTKALQEVEALTGAALFTRTSRGSVPTPFGEVLVRHARAIIAQLRNADREVMELREGHGSVKVGTLPSAAGGVLPSALSIVLKRQPHLQVTVVEGQHDWLTTLLRRGDLDLMTSRLPRRRLPADITQEVLGIDRARLIVRARHPLSRRPRIGLETLGGFGWVLPPHETSMRRQLEATFREAGLDAPAATVESMSFLTNRALVLASDLITVWPQHLAEVEARTGLVKILPLELAQTERPLGVWWRTDPGLSPSAQLLVDALRTVTAHAASELG